jgi:hypothetical protein
MGFYGENVSQATDTGQNFLPVAEKRIRMQFRCMIHRSFWDWDVAAGTWLPRLCRMVISAGINGVDLVKQGDRLVEDWRPAMANYVSKGFQVIQNPARALAQVLPPDPDGVKRGTYLRRWKAKPRGWAYGYVWEKPEDVAGELFWDHDWELERAFRTALRDQVLGGPPDQRLRQKFLREQTKLLRRRADKAALRSELPQVKTRLAEEAEILGAMQKEHARLLDLEGGMRPAVPAVADALDAEGFDEPEPVDLTVPEAPPPTKREKRPSAG